MKTLRKVFLGLAVLSYTGVQAQSGLGSLKGKVTDAQTGEELIACNVLIKKSEEKKYSNGVVTDFDGNFNIKSLDPGKYTVQVAYIGYQTVTVEKVLIKSNQATVRDFKLKPSSQSLEEVVIVQKHSLIERAKTSVALSLAPSKGFTNQNSYAAAQGDFSNEQYDAIQENRFFSAQQTPLSTFSSDVDVAAYANMRRILMDGYLPPKDAIRIEEMINYFNYDYPDPERGKVFSINTQLGDCDWAESHQLLRIGIKTKSIEKDKIPAANLVFLIDVSGSMGSPDKLPLLQKSFRLLVNNLRKKDRVSIVVYAGSSGLVLEPTSGDKKDEIISAIDRLHSGGSTAGAQGIKLAYKTALESFKKNGINRVILATDGDFNVGISDDDKLVKLIEEKREEGIFLSVLGFGTGNYKDSKMEKLADNGNGNHAYIDNLLEAKKVLVNEMGSTLNTVAKDTKFQIEFNPAKVQAYRLIGYENRLLNDEDFNDDTKDAGDVGSGHTVTALYEIVPVGVEMVEEIKPKGDVDPLKYQKVDKTSPEGNVSEELATVKIRHKKPDEKKSTLEVHIVEAEVEEVDEDFKFVSSVIEMGMLLRDSEYKGTSSYESAAKLAEAGKGKDKNGYRSEFIRLLNLAEELHSESADSKR